MLLFLGCVCGAALGAAMAALVLVFWTGRRVVRLEEEMLTVLEAAVITTAKSLTDQHRSGRNYAPRWLQ
jgi:hypothetical protein